MLDTILADVIPVPKESDDYIVRSKWHKKSDSDTLYVIVPPWRGSKDYFKNIRHEILEEKKASIIQYDFSSKILSEDVEGTVKYFHFVADTLSTEINSLVNEYKFKNVVILGISLGAVSASMIAGCNENIKKIILVLPGASLAESLWNGERTQNLRNSLVEKGVTLEQLKKAWQLLAPEEYVEEFKGKEVVIHLSKADKIIPYSLGKRLVDKIRNTGTEVTLIENSFLGHYLTVLKFFLFPKI